MYEPKRVYCSITCVQIIVLGLLCWSNFSGATPRQQPLFSIFSLGKKFSLHGVRPLPFLSVGGRLLCTGKALAAASARLADLCKQKRAQHAAALAQTIGFLHTHRPLVRAPRNPVDPGGRIGEPVELESVNGISFPSDLFIPGSITSPEFIGDLTGAASENVLKVGDTMTGDLIMAHQTGVQLQGSDDGQTVRLQAPAAVTTGYDLTFPDYAGPAHAVMINQGGGTLAWHDISPSSRYIQDGGNAVGEEISIGTQDNYPLVFITNSLERMRLETDGTVSTNGRFSINSGGAYVSGNVEIDGDLDFDGNMDVAGTLTAGGALTVSSGGADITGAVVTDSTITAGDKVTISSGGASISGDVEIDGNLDFDGDMDVSGTLTVGDLFTVSSGGAQIDGGLKLPNNGAIDFYDAQPLQDRAVSLRAPSTIASSYTLQLPDMIGVEGYVLGLRSSVTGELEWVDIGPDSPIVQAGGNDFAGPLSMGTLGADSVSILAGGTEQLVANPTGGVSVIDTLTVGQKLTVQSQGADITGPLVLQDQSQIRLYEAAPGVDYIALQSPGSIPGVYTLTLPTTAGSLGQVLATDGSGNLSWVSSPAPVGAVMIGGNTVSSTMDIGTNNGYGLRLETNNTPRILIAATTGAITLSGAVSAEEDIRLEDEHQLVFEDSGSNTVSLHAPATVTSSYALALPVADGSAGQVLTTNGSGQLSWSSGGTPTGAVLLGGNTVSSTMDIGTNNGYGLRLETNNTPRILIAATTGAITLSGTVSAEEDIRLEDEHQLVFEDSGSNTVSLHAPATVTSSYALALPVADGSAGQVLTTNGSGQLSWSSGGTPTGAVLLGGNTVSSTMQVGSLSNHDLALFTNGLSRMVIGSEGVYAATVDPDFGLALIMDNTGKIGTNVSSRRFKCGIQEIGEDHDRFMQLRPVRYHLRRDRAHKSLYGFIAEELFEIYPELVVLDDQGEPLGIKEYLFAGILVNEVQRLAREVAELRDRLACYEPLGV